jgi:hypothetical protein
MGGFFKKIQEKLQSKNPMEIYSKNTASVQSPSNYKIFPKSSKKSLIGKKW